SSGGEIERRKVFDNILVGTSQPGGHSILSQDRVTLLSSTSGWVALVVSQRMKKSNRNERDQLHEKGGQPDCKANRSLSAPRWRLPPSRRMRCGRRSVRKRTSRRSSRPRKGMGRRARWRRRRMLPL